ncbi:MAG: class II aldolase/adducin family protein [Candidatus Aphodomorpha sp.]
MRMQEERAEAVRFAKLLIARGLTRGTGGNISVRKGDLVAITPSGVDYESMTAEDMVVVDLSGRIVEGSLRPSSECGMHLACYRAQSAFGAVVHTHSTFATTLACMHRSLPPIHYLIGYAGGTVPCIPYYPFGSEELAQAAAAGMAGRNAVLLGNHGLLAAGADLDYAFSVAEETEFVAELYYRTELLGGGRLLSDADMEEALRRFAAYGQKQWTEES